MTPSSTESPFSGSGLTYFGANIPCPGKPSLVPRSGEITRINIGSCRSHLVATVEPESWNRSVGGRYPSSEIRLGVVKLRGFDALDSSTQASQLASHTDQRKSAWRSICVPCLTGGTDCELYFSLARTASIAAGKDGIRGVQYRGAEMSLFKVTKVCGDGRFRTRMEGLRGKK